MFIQWKKLQSLRELRLEHSCSTAGNSVIDLYLAPKLVTYKAVYWAVPAWFFIVCLTLFLANCCIVFDGFIRWLISSFTVKRWGPWPAGQSFCRSRAGSRAQGGRVDCMGELLPLRLLLPSLAFSFFWLQSVILCWKSAKGKMPEDRQSFGWKIEKLIICFWREFPFLFSSDCCSRLLTGWRRKVVDFRCTDIWHHLIPGLMPR